MKRIALIATILLLVLTTGCKSKRSVIATPETVVVETPEKPVVETPQTVDTPQEEVEKPREETKAPVEKPKAQEEVLFENMLASQKSWQTLVAKGSVSLGSLSSSFEMRMINNESMQISLRPIFGIEIARVVVTTDSIFLYDKLNKRYIAESIKTFSDKIPFEPTISDLQNALIGHPFILGHASLNKNNFDDFVYETAGTDWAMQPRELPEGIVYMFGLNKELLFCALAQQMATQRELRCDYQEYADFSGQMMPSRLDLSARGGQKNYSINIRYSSVSWNTRTSVEKLSTNGMKKTTLAKVVDSLLK